MGPSRRHGVLAIEGRVSLRRAAGANWQTLATCERRKNRSSTFCTGVIQAATNDPKAAIGSDGRDGSDDLSQRV